MTVKRLASLFLARTEGKTAYGPILTREKIALGVISFCFFLICAGDVGAEEFTFLNFINLAQIKALANQKYVFLVN